MVPRKKKHRPRGRCSCSATDATFRDRLSLCIPSGRPISYIKYVYNYSMQMILIPGLEIKPRRYAVGTRLINEIADTCQRSAFLIQGEKRQFIRQVVDIKGHVP